MLRRRRPEPEQRDSGPVLPPDAAQVIALDYPVHPRPRFGHGLPDHPQLRAILDAGRDRYRRRLAQIVELAPELRKIPVESPAAPDEPCWRNGYLPGLDGSALYSLLVNEQPATYLEVGSGNSTRFARRAIRDHGLATRIVSIDPTPRAEIDAICDEVIREPFEDTDLGRLDALTAGDIVFVDNSHRVFTNSDATVVFMEVLPNLPPGVFLHVHDIFLPEDYPAAWNDRFYSEQYLLAAYLLGGGAGVEVDFPAWFVAQDADLSAVVTPLFDSPEMAGAERHGNSFWMRRT